MKKEKISEENVEVSESRAFVTNQENLNEDLKNQKNMQKKQLKVLKKEEKLKEKQAKQEKVEQEKKDSEIKKINYFKKLQIVQEELKKRKEQKKKENAEYEKQMSMLYKKQKLPPWIRLDNAGMIYPPAKRKYWNFVYRISAVLKNPVDIEILKQATYDILPRFPSFNVCLKRGLFWHYFERAPRKLEPERDFDFPCQPFDLSDSSANLIRVLYDDFKISFECFHAIADGRGSLMFLNSLLCRYFELQGVVFEDKSTVLSFKDMPTEEEIEDSFLKHYDKKKAHRPQERAAYKIKGTNLAPGSVNSIVAEFSVQNLKKIAKESNCSLTVLLCACIGYVVYLKKEKSNKKPVSISVPIDCRTRLGSKTLRNFSSYINVDVDGDNLSLQDVIEIFKTEFAKIDKDFLLGNINANVKIQKNFFVKIIPLCVKQVIMKLAFNLAGENYQTLAFSNIGGVNAPKEFGDLIDRYEVNLGKSGYNTKSMGVVSFGDKLCITFSSNIEENETERDYFRLLASLGADIKIFSNRRDIYGNI